MRGLRGKRVLVSGGSSGIGEAAARRFLEEGARVHLGGLDSDEVAAAVAGLDGLGEVSGSAGDVSLEADVEQLVQQAKQALGGIDILINNAGIAWREPFLDITPEHWDQMLAVNLRGMFLVAQAVAHVMVDQGGGGAIVNMSSTNGIDGEEDYTHYNASKGGVLLLTKTMAVELGPRGIRVNALCPGSIRTPMSHKISGQAGAQAARESTLERLALGRVGRPEEVAAAYAFLASDDASYITGVGLIVDGGQLAVM